MMEESNSNSRSRSMLSGLSLFLLTAVTMTLVPGSYSISLRALASGDFYIGDPLQVKASNLTSPKTQLSYNFYSLSYCKPSKTLNRKTLKEFLQGEDFQNSVYTFDMRKEQPCKVACRVKLDAEAAKDFKEKIHDDYRVNMNLGNLPVTQQKVEGFRVGFKGYYPSGEEVYFIHNHLSFRVMYHRNPQIDSAQIVGFEVDPYSISHEYEGPWNEKNPKLLTCNSSTNGLNQAFNFPLRIKTDSEVVFTYDVSFYEYDHKPRIRSVWNPDPKLII
ncbi:hypothetical protein CRYUN_Cryun33cG0064600 [Craigia yunnanensis]